MLPTGGLECGSIGTMGKHGNIRRMREPLLDGGTPQNHAHAGCHIRHHGAWCNHAGTYDVAVTWLPGAWVDDVVVALTVFEPMALVDAAGGNSVGIVDGEYATFAVAGEWLNVDGPRMVIDGCSTHGDITGRITGHDVIGGKECEGLLRRPTFGHTGEIKGHMGWEFDALGAHVKLDVCPTRCAGRGRRRQWCQGGVVAGAFKGTTNGRVNETPAPLPGPVGRHDDIPESRTTVVPCAGVGVEQIELAIGAESAQYAFPLQHGLFHELSLLLGGVLICAINKALHLAPHGVKCVDVQIMWHDGVVARGHDSGCDRW